MYIGEDYDDRSMQISIIGNQSTAIVSIPVTDDRLAEGLETFSGKLEVVSQSQNLSSVSIIRIEIIDDEGIKFHQASKLDYMMIINSP